MLAIHQRAQLPGERFAGYLANLPGPAGLHPAAGSHNAISTEQLQKYSGGINTRVRFRYAVLTDQSRVPTYNSKEVSELWK